MRNYRSLFLDGSESVPSSIKGYITRLPFFADAEICYNVGEAILLMAQPKFDIIFLTIRQLNQSAIILLQSLNQHNIPVIAISSDSNLASIAYDLAFVDFLLNTSDFPRFVRAVNCALKITFSDNHVAGLDVIFLKVGRNIQRFSYKDILYIESFASYYKVHLATHIELVNDTISNLEASLPKHSFIPVHKSYMINVEKITSYGHRYVCVSSMKIPLGAVYRIRFQNFFNLLNKLVTASVAENIN